MRDEALGEKHRRDLQRQARRLRYTRRAQSAKWLIDAALSDMQDGVVVDQETGEVSEQRPFVRPPRPGRCSWRVATTVGVHASAGHGHYSGTSRCASVWACPVCAAVIRAERAREITEVVEAHQAAGGTVLMVTLTLRHDRHQGLESTLDTVLTGWQKFLQGRFWAGESFRDYEQRAERHAVRSIGYALDPDRYRCKPRPLKPRYQGFKERFGVQGFVRSVEVTHGRSGWHPHVHGLLLLRENPTAEQLHELEDDLFGRWSKHATATTGKTPTRENGIDVQRVDDDGKVLAQYIGKVQDEGKRWGAGAEMARADVKRGNSGSRVPFELLDDETMPLPQRRRLWAEFVRATKGRRAITWSRGLRERFGINEREDEEIIEDAHSDTLRWEAFGDGYDKLRRRDPLMLAVVLEAAERESWDVVAQYLPGHPVDIADTPCPSDGQGALPLSARSTAEVTAS